MSLLAIFGISMAHLEGVVVVYLRKALGMTESEPIRNASGKLTGRNLFIEMTREASTIVMLLIISIIAGDTWLERVVLFLWTFAFWDLFYYVSLYVLIKWPPDLRTIDILFLIPVPWIAPVWLPLAISSLTIVIIALLMLLKVF
jgi:hypothetical protein